MAYQISGMGGYRPYMNDYEQQDQANANRNAALRAASDLAAAQMGFNAMMQDDRQSFDAAQTAGRQNFEVGMRDSSIPYREFNELGGAQAREKEIALSAARAAAGLDLLPAEQGLRQAEISDRMGGIDASGQLRPLQTSDEMNRLAMAPQGRELELDLQRSRIANIDADTAATSDRTDRQGGLDAATITTMLRPIDEEMRNLLRISGNSRLSEEERRQAEARLVALREQRQALLLKLKPELQSAFPEPVAEKPPSEFEEAVDRRLRENMIEEQVNDLNEQGNLLLDEAMVEDYLATSDPKERLSIVEAIAEKTVALSGGQLDPAAARAKVIADINEIEQMRMEPSKGLRKGSIDKIKEIWGKR